MIFLWIGLSMGLVFMACAFVGYPLWKNRQVGLSMVMSLLVLLSSILLYSYLGQLSSTAHWLVKGQKSYQLQKQFLALGSVNEIISRMQQEVATAPNDVRRWFLLGRLWYTQGNFKSAGMAFSKAYALDNQDPEIILNYARSLYFDDTKNRLQAKELAQKAQALSPDNADIKEFIGRL